MASFLNQKSTKLLSGTSLLHPYGIMRIADIFVRLIIPLINREYFPFKGFTMYDSQIFKKKLLNIVLEIMFE